MYDTMYTQNAQQYRELKMTVLAGKKALADFNANQLPALEAEAAASGDAMQAQVLKDFKSKLDRFAKRLDDLDRISVVTLQTAPQIKIIQNADQTIVDKIDTTISTTIPVWKSQMVIALGLSNQRKALDLQNKADDGPTSCWRVTRPPCTRVRWTRKRPTSVPWWKSTRWRRSTPNSSPP